MAKGAQFVLLVLVGCLLLAGRLPAASIVDVDQTDLMVITGAFEDDAINELLVFEDYDERFLVPYPSHDGWAIVNQQGGFFDKIVTFTADDLDGPWMLDFRVFNSGPHDWSDYHFEFWDETFTNRLDMTGVVDFWDADIFQNSSFDGHSLEFWAPQWQLVGQTQQFLIRLTPPPGVPFDGSFGIRQIATTVPEPVTMLGLLLGVTALGRYLKRRQRQD